MVASKTLLFLPLLLAGALAAPGPASAVVAPIPGYTVTELQWEVEVFPGQLKNFTGTVEKVHSQVTQLNPGWEQDVVAQREPEEARASLDKRYIFYQVDCRPPGWQPAEYGAIGSGISYLKTLRGSPRYGPGPGACGRVSCSYDSAIWWCNDNRKPFSVHSWLDIADGAGEIFRKCKECDRLLGQAFAEQHWNVIVRKDTSNC
ncbi:hypothetical protein J3459_017553 [Metarhizium acridum]|nr:hypothetical protein J3459_017553 [Metarhizium acridum]